MALSKTVTSEYGFKAIDAYHRVVATTIVNKDQIQFYVRSHIDAEKPFFAEKVISAPYDLNGENPIKQAYNYLKTLPDFSDSTDC